MSENRPDPDALLQKVKADEAKAKRGKLKIFFGASAGVGKTYAMLSEGREKFTDGADVVVGYAEPHNRPETEALLLGLDILPPLLVEYRGTTLKEFDLDAALKRHPELILVDELAHSNVEHARVRHSKRWQDIEELLKAGINVYTTLNVQHVESLNDVVAQITGVIVRETVPDSVVETADEIELIDLPPDDLLDRLAEGKVYVAAQAERAMESFFRKSNLTALRELALRKTAERVNAQVQHARLEQAAVQTWPTTERLLVCVAGTDTSARVIRAAKRMATALHAPWIAVHVELPVRRPSQERAEKVLQNLSLAERLGAQTVTLSGESFVEEIISYARQHNVTKIVVGKPTRPKWYDYIRPNPVDQFIRGSGEIDVYVIQGDRRPERRHSLPRFARPAEPPLTAWTAGYAFAAACIATAIAAGMHNFGLAEANLVMVYIVAVAAVAARWGQWPAVVASLSSVVTFDFFFVPPRFKFAVSDAEYLITFGVMLAVGLLIGNLTSRVRDQAMAARLREQRAEALSRMTSQLANTRDTIELVRVAKENIGEVFRAKADLHLRDDEARISPDAAGLADSNRQSVIHWVFEHMEAAGTGTNTLSASNALYFPLSGSQGAVGVLEIQLPESSRYLSPEQWRLLETFANQIALAIERDQLAKAARRSQVQMESERLRSSLLSSVSHDLRTPLAVITGASSSLLLSENQNSDPQSRRELIQTIAEESERLTRLVGNLLDITKLEAGLRVAKKWESLEEIVGSALRRTERQLHGRAIEVSLPADLPMIEADGVLIEQVLINLLDNASRYTPANSPIKMKAERGEQSVTLSIIDQGPGLKPGEETMVFEKFYRGSSAGPQRGAGLGLAICRAILEAHGGRIWAERLDNPAGTAFHLTLPLTGEPPSLADATRAAQLS